MSCGISCGLVCSVIRHNLRHQAFDGTRVRATITKKILDQDAENHQRLKFLIEYDEGRIEELIDYATLSDTVEEQIKQEMNDPDRLFTFTRVEAHQGPLKPGDPDYKGSMYNCLLTWTDGSRTWEPQGIVAKTDPVTLAQYAKDNNLLHLPGWKCFKSIVKNQKKFGRMLKQARLYQINHATVYKYGYRVPRNIKQAYQFDEENKNTRWAQSVDTELAKLAEYNVFIDGGTKAPPPGYAPLTCHFVFDVKHDGRHRARYVADGHLTNPPPETTSSTVISLRGVRLCFLVAELNDLTLLTGDISSAYLEAKTNEKLYVIAGPEFKELAGHFLIVDKALYGLAGSGARWHEHLAEILREEGFFPCEAEPDLWIDSG
jgi:hypothetical protein